LSRIWIAAAWAVTFPAATWSLAMLFRRAGTTGADEERGAITGIRATAPYQRR
jgi:hypothetical protein